MTTTPKKKAGSAPVYHTPSVQAYAFKEALYIIWCGVHRLGDSGVKVVLIDSAILQHLLPRRVSYCYPAG